MKKKPIQERQKPLSVGLSSEEIMDCDEEKLEIVISCMNLIDPSACSGVSFQVSVSSVNSQMEDKEISMTEIISDTPNPSFQKTIVQPYKFCSSGVLRFSVVKIEEKLAEVIGTALVEVDKIASNPEGQSRIPILGAAEEKKAALLLKLNKFEEEIREEITFFLQGNRIKNIQFFSKSNPFFRLYRLGPNGSYMLVHETESLKKNLNPVFQPEVVTSGKMCGGDLNCPLICEVLDRMCPKKVKLIGSADLTLAKVIQGEKAYLFYKKGHKKPRGELIFNIARTKPLPSFLQSLKNGQQFRLAVGIDFTASNHLDNEPSLHQIKPGEKNQYQSCLFEFASLILNYDREKKISLYGFGAIIDPDFKNQPHKPASVRCNHVRHCFNLSFQSDPNVQEIEGLMSAYEACVDRVEMLGPTCFAPVFRTILDSVKAAYHKLTVPSYTVGLILTDGDIHDLKETMDIIVEAAKYPVSFIIIGVGQSNFKKTSQLSGSQVSGTNGDSPIRECVQFALFREHNEKVNSMARQLLSTITKQFMDYTALQ